MKSNYSKSRQIPPNPIKPLSNLHFCSLKTTRASSKNSPFAVAPPSWAEGNSWPSQLLHGGGWSGSLSLRGRAASATWARLLMSFAGNCKVVISQLARISFRDVYVYPHKQSIYIYIDCCERICTYIYTHFSQWIYFHWNIARNSLLLTIIHKGFPVYVPFCQPFVNSRIVPWSPYPIHIEYLSENMITIDYPKIQWFDDHFHTYTLW